MLTTMQQRREFAANWASDNPILAQGEIGIDLTALAAGTPFVKVGDGAKAWASLPFSSTPSPLPLTPTLVKTANYTASANQIIPCDVSGGGFTVTIPTAPADGTGMVVKIVKQTTLPTAPNTLTFACGGSDVLNIASGSTSGALTLKGQAVRLQYSASAAIWYVISTDAPIGNPIYSEFIGTVAGSAVAGTNVAVPAGAIAAEIVMIGAGGAGGSGRVSASGTAAFGGGGGGGGGAIYGFYIPSTALGTTFSYSIPTAPAAGAAQATSSTNGNNGATGGANLSLTTNAGFIILVQGGSSGSGGSTTAGTAGNGALGLLAGTIGGAGAAGAGGVPGLSLTGAASGGGSGAGLATTPVATNGGNGGFNFVFGLTSAPTGGVAGGAAPGAGAAAVRGSSGQGAGGGASSTTGNGQTGASSLGYGGGGGGGGAALNGSSSGAGGTGGPGYLGIKWIYA